MNDLFKSIVTGVWTEFLEFIERDGDIDIRDRDGRTPLTHAVLNNQLDVVKLLIVRGADVNSRDRSGYSALHFAADRYLLDVAKLLLEANAYVDIEDVHGNTPLWRAVYSSRGRGQMIHLILQHGADKNHRNKHGKSPLELAKLIGNYDVTQFMS